MLSDKRAKPILAFVACFEQGARQAARPAVPGALVSGLLGTGCRLLINTSGRKTGYPGEHRDAALYQMYSPFSQRSHFLGHFFAFYNAEKRFFWISFCTSKKK